MIYGYGQGTQSGKGPGVHQSVPALYGMRPKIRVLRGFSGMGKLFESDRADSPALGQGAIQYRAQGIELIQ